jgi:hypothetical protein
VPATYRIDDRLNGRFYCLIGDLSFDLD